VFSFGRAAVSGLSCNFGSKKCLAGGSYADSSKIKASYKDGVLELSIPKSEKAKPKQIKVGVK